MGGPRAVCPPVIVGIFRPFFRALKKGRQIGALQSSSCAWWGAPTGLQLLRWERVLLTLWIEGLEHLEKWSKVVAPQGRPLKNSMKIVEKCRNYFWTLFDDFLRFLLCAKAVEEMCLNTLWCFLTFFDVAPFCWPLFAVRWPLCAFTSFRDAQVPHEKCRLSNKRGHLLGNPPIRLKPPLQQLNPSGGSPTSSYLHCFGGALNHYND